MVSEYKKTPIGLLPIDWECKKNKELFDNKSIKNFPNEPVLSVTQDKGVIPRDFLDKRITMESSNTANFKLVEYGDFIISLRSFQGGLEVSKYRGIVSPAYTVIRPKLPIETDFFKYFFKSNKFINILNKAVIGIRDGKQISFSVFSDLYTPYPPLPEQRKIAAILSSVDEAIEKTEAIIEQTEKVKKGLMQQLFTKGIGHTKFKKTEIGEIPEEWEVLEVADVAKTTSGGTPSRNNPEYFNGSIPWIKTGELKEKYIYDTEEKITEEAVKNSSAKLVPKNSVIVAMYGATIGNVSINKIDATTNQACCVVIPQKERLNYEFLYYLLAFWKEKLIKLGAGGAQPNISQQIIKNLLIPMPSLKEQMEIANILAILDKKIQNEKKKFDSLSNLKKGLMQVLLTGKVRVKVDDEVMSQ